ncbi:hypothetical protein Ccrd_008815 [Cynara cardunculus var. scolymus]|uniref:Uncharacterized protein n=1 Tax=Cynara cardunculus var. scolymus TaxID=59895 RepID=A0A118JT77_CYNCS|nr:hypothetical protein Ccrd_008815 [Cynara cardunculus var. scolymus]
MQVPYNWFDQIRVFNLCIHMD